MNARRPLACVAAVGALLARLRPVRATVLTSLYRPLASDDRRVAFWRRHVVIGIVISEIAAVTVGVYALLTDTGARLHPVVLALVPTVMFGTPLLLVLPLDRVTGIVTDVDPADGALQRLVAAGLRVIEAR